MKDKLLAPDVVAAAVRAYTEHANRLLKERQGRKAGAEKELAAATAQIARIWECFSSRPADPIQRNSGLYTMAERMRRTGWHKRQQLSTDAEDRWNI